MCRIFGEVSKDQNLTRHATFEALCLLSKAGGPDSTGFWRDQHCQLGFNRLAILDTSDHANQPLLSPSGRYALVFNGEIYNFRDLISRYHIKLASLRSTSDTEVIAQLLDVIPISNLFRELNGMFAIAVWDLLEQQLYLARDFAGIKPLFFGLNNHGIVFASQFDQIYKHPWFASQLKISLKGFMGYMRLGFMHAPETMYENICQLNPGEYLIYDCRSNTHEKFRFKNIYDSCRNQSLRESDQSLPSQVLNVLNEIVGSQMVADVPLGTFLSGGIDSPIITAMASKIDPQLTAMTIGVNDARYNEAEIAQSYAQSLKVKNMVQYITPSEMLKINDDHFQSLHEPFGDYSSLPTFLISKVASRHFKVMLSGDGGDEVFWGYPRFLNVVNHASWFKFPLFVRDVFSKGFRLSGRKVSYAVNQYQSIGEWLCEQHSHNSTEMLKQCCAADHQAFAGLDHYQFNGNSRLETLNFLQRNEFFSHLQRVLIKVDRTSMGNGLEVRVPFLDERILRLSEQIIPEMGLRHNQPKYLLHKIMETLYPSQLVNRQKMGFTVPIREWMRGPLKEEVNDLLLATPLFGADLFNNKELHRHVESFLKDDNGNEWGIWILYALQKWHQNNRY